MAIRISSTALTLTLAASLLLAACNNSDNTPHAEHTNNESQPPSSQETASATERNAVLEQYADLAHATYLDALNTAKALKLSIDALIEAPSEDTLHQARQAWLKARIPYQQSEAFRFGNALVDDWEGQLNAWPLDEGLIDYVAADAYEHELGNEGATANIIANSEISVAGKVVDVTDLTPDLLAELNEIGAAEANVATGYHAIEFLLWGQDLNGYEQGAGNRLYTDYLQDDGCTHGNCDRRATYLSAVTELLINDLQWMVDQWASDTADNYRAELLASPVAEGIQKMLFGMGSLSLGELAGERMKVALEANSYEDEHDCFSDNTHNSHYYNALGVQNIYLGLYKTTDGVLISGPSLSSLVAHSNAELDNQLRDELQASVETVGRIKAAAEDTRDPLPFDMMIAPGNQRGAELINASIAALVQQTDTIEQVAKLLGIESLESDDAGHTF